MKKIVTIIVILLLMLYFIIVRQTDIGASEEAILIKRPWFMGEKGLVLTPETTGTVWHTSSTEVKVISLKAFTIKEEVKEVLTLDNIPMDFNIYLTFQRISGKTPQLLQKFGVNHEWYQSIMKEPLLNSVENLVHKQTFTEVLNNEKVKKEFESALLFGIKNLLKKLNIPIILLDVKINEILPPQKIVDEAIKTELIKEEIRRKKEEKNLAVIREKSEKARAKADKSYMATMGMTMREYLALKRIELQEKQLFNQRFAIEKAQDSNGSIKVYLNLEK